MNLIEQKIITAIINGHSERKGLTQYLQRTSGSLGTPLVKLQNIGLIKNEHDGKYEISELILKLWLDQEFKTKGVFPSYRNE